MPSIREIGDTCVGAKINGRLMPLRTQLGNGDQVEIVTSKAQTPSPTWERFVVTGKARARIRRFIRTQQRAQYLDLGRAIVQKAFRQEGHEFSERPLEGGAEDLQLRRPSRISMSRSARGWPPDARWSTPLSRSQAGRQGQGRRRWRAPGARRRHNDTAVPIRGLIPGMALHFAGCCHPLPGDRIVGIVTTGKGVTIHTIDCDTLENFADDARALARRRLEQRARPMRSMSAGSTS